MLIIHTPGMEKIMKKFTYTIEGSDGVNYGSGTCDKANESTAIDLMVINNPTDDSVLDAERDPNGNGWEFTVSVSGSDDFYVTFEAI